MADANNRTLEQVRTEIEAERKELAGAVGDLRGGLGKVANTAARLKSKLPFGVMLASGVGAAIRHFARRRRH